MKKRKRIEREMDKTQVRLETAARRKDWDAVLIFDERIDGLMLDLACMKGWHNFVAGRCSHCRAALDTWRPQGEP